MLLGAVVVVVLLGLLGAVAWQQLTQSRADLLLARDALQEAVADPEAVRTRDGRAATRSRIESGIARVQRADRRIRRSVPLGLAQLVPGLRSQRQGLLDLLSDVETAAEHGRRLLVAVDRTATDAALTEGRVPIDGLSELEANLRVAGEGLAPLSQRSAAGLWGVLAEARRSVNDIAASSSARLLDAADAVGAARPFVGADGPRRYFLAIQNNAEMRDQGMVLSYGLLTFDKGQLKVERTGPINDLALDGPVEVPIAEGTKAVFGDLQPTRLFQSVNAPADFAWSGRVMTQMYERATGDRVDGVVALDVPGLARLLAVVGPIQIPGLEAVDSSNAARVLLHDLYAQNPQLTDQTRRKDRLSEVAAAVSARLTTGSHDVIGLGRQLGDASAGGHFRIWSSREDEEQVFERIGLGGGPAVRDPERTFHVAVQNATVAKLDYFVKPSVAMTVSVTPVGTAIVRTTVTIANTAPPRPRPSYQFGGYGYGEGAPGQYLSRVQLWGPRGAVQLGSVEESGLVLNQQGAAVDAGDQQTVTFETIVPRAVRDGVLQLRLVPQPRVEPMALRVRVGAEGWTLADPSEVERTWDRTLVLRWRLRR